jgi:FkbM family methyltransferase
LWQLLQNTGWLNIFEGSGKMLYKSKHFDFYLYLDNPEDYIQKKFIDEGVFDEEIYFWSKKNIKSGWLIYDIGANIFEYSEMFSRLSGKDGVVYSFEPQKHLVENYKKFQEKNSYTNAAKIEIFNFALGNKNGVDVLLKNIKNIGGSTLSKKFVEIKKGQEVYSEKEHVSIARADCLDLPEQIPDLLKMDIEGYEWEAWQGFTENMKKAKNIIAEVGSYTEKDLLAEYFGYGRNAYYIDGTFAADRIKDLEKILLKNKKGQYNIVFK